MKYIIATLLLTLPTLLNGQALHNSEFFNNYFSRSISMTAGEEWDVIKTIDLFGSGSLLAPVTNQSEGNESINNPIGSLGMNISSSLISLNIFYSYNNRSVLSMENSTDIATVLVNPNTSGQSVSIDLISRIAPSLGVQSTLQVCDNFYRLVDSTEIDASPLQFSIGLIYSPFDFKLFADYKVDILLSAGYTYKRILGDFNNSNGYELDGFIYEPQGYHGFRSQIAMRIQSLELIAVYSYNYTGDETLQGFTGNQILFGVNVSSSFISLNPGT
ncbi:MAG: hypothetical protein HWD92_04890 [Flavobacteriia bacterium]|nr:hypothetical protein [Flavobacteriia bacterium]